MFSILETCLDKICLMPYANNRGADQPAHPGLISTIVVHCLDTCSIIPILAKSKISRLWLASEAELASLSHTWSQIPKTDFLVTRHNFISGDDMKLLSLSYQFTLDMFPMFVEQLHKHSWRTDVSLLGADEWRLNCEPGDFSSEKKNF